MTPTIYTKSSMQQHEALHVLSATGNTKAYRKQTGAKSLTQKLANMQSRERRSAPASPTRGSDSPPPTSPPPPTTMTNDSMNSEIDGNPPEGAWETHNKAGNANDCRNAERNQDRHAAPGRANSPPLALSKSQLMEDDADGEFESDDPERTRHLLDILVKTVYLMRCNKRLEMRLKQLKADAAKFISSVQANSNNPTV